MTWKIAITDNNLVKGFFPPDYLGALPIDLNIIEVSEEEKDHIYCLMPAYYDAKEKTFKHWTPPPLSISDYRSIKLDELTLSFNSCVSSSISTTQGYLMQFNISDSLKMQGAIQLLKATGQTEGYLTDANDETHYEVPLSTMEAVKIEMLAAYAACHARKQELRTAINAAQTEEELNAIEITWPV